MSAWLWNWQQPAIPPQCICMTCIHYMVLASIGFFSWSWVCLLTPFSGHQFQTLHLTNLEHDSIVDFHEVLAEWTKRYLQTSILIILEGDIHASTSEKMYTNPAGTLCHTSAESVRFIFKLMMMIWHLANYWASCSLSLLFGSAKNPISGVGHGGQVGLISLLSGASLRSDLSWCNLIIQYVQLPHILDVFWYSFMARQQLN